MKLFTAISVLLTVIPTAFAQTALIGYPPSETSVRPGDKLTVEVDRPNTLSSSIEVGVVIGLQSCQHGGCHDPADGLGTVLYNGGFDPQYGPPRVWWKPPHQNFTVTIPSDAPKGKAVLGLVHVALIGAGAAPFLETLNVTLKIV